MGGSLRMFAERRDATGVWQPVGGDRWWSSICTPNFGFLCDTRNYSAIKPLRPLRGLPPDACEPARDHHKYGDAVAATWYTTEELRGFDYTQIIEDRRVTAMNPRTGCADGAMTCAEGEGERMPWTEFLGTDYFDMLDRLVPHGVERVVVIQS